MKWRVSQAPDVSKRYWIDRRSQLPEISPRADIDKTHEIQNVARELLASGEVSCVIGYELGPRNRTRPAFVYNNDDVNRLVWNQICTHNLTTYLKQKLSIDSGAQSGDLPRVAIVVKPCDSRSINVLLAENRFKREQIHIIGVSCEGIQEGAGYGKANGQHQKRCLSCGDRVPIIYDILVGDSPIVEGVQPANLAIERLEAMSTAQRMEFWLSQFDRCIRCYACRQACSICDCPTCLYESDDSLWVGMNIEINEKRTFHLGRAYHMAGRCVGCDECERVCPVNIPISLLNHKLSEEIKDAFDFEAGLSITPSPITTSLREEVKS